jgi:hypothetical protein
MTMCSRRTGDTKKDTFYHPTLIEPLCEKGHTTQNAVAAYILPTERRTNTKKCTIWTEMYKSQTPVSPGYKIFCDGA